MVDIYFSNKDLSKLDLGVFQSILMEPVNSPYHFCQISTGFKDVSCQISITELFRKEARGHSFDTNAKFSEKLTFVTPWYTHVCVSGGKKC